MGLYLTVLFMQL